MKILFSATAVAALALATSAFAGDWRADNYAQFNFGSSVAGSTRATATGLGTATADVKPGFLGGGLVGHAFGNGVSVEIEGLYDQNQVSGADARVEAYGGLANLKYEMPTHYKVLETTVSPYIGGGVGYGQSKYNISGLTASENGVMWQVKVGLAIHPSEKATVDLGYRFLQLPEFNAGGGNKIDTYVHVIGVGIRWSL